MALSESAANPNWYGASVGYRLRTNLGVVYTWKFTTASVE